MFLVYLSCYILKLQVFLINCPKMSFSPDFTPEQKYVAMVTSVLYMYDIDVSL